MKKIQVKITGMSCTACAKAIERGLKKKDGVQAAAVIYAGEKALIEFDPVKINYQEIVKTIRSTGYDVNEEKSDTIAEERKKVKMAYRKMLFAWGFCLPVMLWMLPLHLWGIYFPNKAVYMGGMFLLPLIGTVIAGKNTYQSAVKSLTHGGANMDVLIMLGTLSSLATGVLAYFLPIMGFAPIAIMIMAFHLTGRFLETKAKGHSSEAIFNLLLLNPKTAILADGEREIPLSEIKKGDILLVKPGAKIPADGVIIEGKSYVEEAMVTGEPQPQKKQIGDFVIGATQNKQGYLKIKAEKVGADSFLSQIIAQVELAQGSKVPIQALADRITEFFVPFILILSVLAFFVSLSFPQAMQQLYFGVKDIFPWVGLQHSPLTNAVMALVSVLVIACPCALGLATPTALMVGSGLGAQKGILIKKGEAIQVMREIKAVVFDKTGTLTFGKPQVTALLPYKITEDDLLKVALTAENNSEHPLAFAIKEYARQKGMLPQAIDDFAAVEGKGVVVTCHGDRFMVGSENFLREQNITLNLLQIETAKTVIHVARNDEYLGNITIADEVRPEAKTVIELLRAKGKKTVMITGDNQKTAQAIAKELNIEEVIAEALPLEKAQHLEELRRKYGKIAMVGDGINDAVALKTADVGIALGSGTDIAVEASDITLIRNNLFLVNAAIELSQATFGKIKQNLFWAFAYNLIAIPLAFCGLLHPLIAEIAMALSSITVVTNANLLKNIKLREEL